MYWISGYYGQSPTPRRPLGASQLWAIGDSAVWLVGDVARGAVGRATSPLRDVLIGPCSVTNDELDQMAWRGVPGDVVTRWAGSYAVVERIAAGVTVWTDLASAVPIYTNHADGGLYWATSARHLAEVTARRLDIARVSAEILAPSSTLLSGSRTYFEGVSLIPPGHQLTMSRQGSGLRRAWSPVASDADPAATLRRELDAAVRVRVADAVSPSADLSGGLDSTALTLLAAEVLSPERSVAAFTVHGPTAVPVGDLAYALEAAEHPGIRHHLLTLEAGHLPYGRLDDLPATDEPSPSAKAYARFAFQLDAMHGLVASDAHLTGDGGDSVLMTPLAWIGDLMRVGHLARAIAEATRYARARRTTPRAILERAASYAWTQPGDALITQAKIWRGGGVPMRAARAARVWIAPHDHLPWATADARVLAADVADEAATHRHQIAPGNAGRDLIAQAAADVGRTAHADAQLAAQHGITLYNPYVDSRVIDACLSVPTLTLTRPSAYKPTLRNALADLYSPTLAARTTKGAFTSDYYQGLRANLPDLLDLAGGHLAQLGLVDAGQLRATLQLTASGAPIPLYTLDSVLGIEAWLAAIASERPATWVPATASPEVMAP